MTITQTLADFRIDNWCDIYQFPNETGLRYYNDNRDELIDAIIEEKEDYFYNYYTSNTVIWQNEYTLAKRWDIAEDWVTILDWVAKVKAVSWKINSTDTEFTLLRAVNLNNLEKDIESYDETSTPFFCLMDNSIFIYPAPKEVTEFKIYGIMYPKKLALTDTDTLPDQHTKTILLWVAERYFTSQKLTNEAILARNKFEEAKLRVCKALSWRITWPVQRTTPNITNLK